MSLVNKFGDTLTDGLQIDVRNKDDVIAAFEFSKKEGVTLSFKNTGVR